METNLTKRTDIYQIDPRNVVVMEDFNVRRDFDLDELKEQIKAKGVLNPISVIPFKDEDGVEKYRLVDGERRLRATLAAIDEGADIKRIKALYVNKNAKPEELLIEQMMRNEGKRFTEYECAIMFQRFKENYGYTQAEIAEKFKKSPAFISKCLSLMDLPPEILQRIEKNHISVKAARDIASSYESEQQQIAAVEKTVKTVQEQGKKTATNRDVNAGMKETKEAKAVYESLMKVWAYLDGDNYVDICLLATLLDKTENLSYAIRKYKEQSKN